MICQWIHSVRKNGKSCQWDRSFKKGANAKFPEVGKDFTKCSLNLNYKKMLLQSLKEKETFASLNQMNDELDRLESMGILSKVKYRE